MRMFRLHCTGLVLLMVFGVVIYAQALDGPFVFDDLSNILQAPGVRLTSLEPAELVDVVRTDTGTYLRRPLPRLSFALNYYFSGQQFNAVAYKLTNLIIHLVNGGVLYTLVFCVLRCGRRFSVVSDSPTRTAWFALAVAGLWLIHPLQLTTVLYAVQRMTSLAALGVLVGLLMFVVGRGRLTRGHPGSWRLMVGGIAIGFLLGSLCKETAVLTPLFAVLLEWFFFDRQPLVDSDRRKLYRVYALMLLLPVAAALYWGIMNQAHLFSVYGARDFTVGERLLTETRVLFFYLALILVPDSRRYGLFHDDFVVSTGLLEPLSTLASLLGWGVLLALAWFGVRRRQIWAFGILWYLVGHSIESTILGLELVHEHRNYVPSIGIFFGLVYVGTVTLTSVVPRRVVKLLVVVLVVLCVSFVTWSRAGNWVDRTTLAESWVRNHPSSYRALDSLAYAYRERGESVSLVYRTYQQAAQLGSKEVLPLIEMLKIVQALRMSGLAQTAEYDGRIDALGSVLTLDRRWLDAADGALDIEVQRRLNEYRLDPASSLALFNLFVCAVEGEPTCKALVSANLRWHRVAVLNPQVSPFDRLRLTQTLEALERLELESTDQ